MELFFDWKLNTGLWTTNSYFRRDALTIKKFLYFVLAFHFCEVLFYNTYVYFIYIVDFPTCLTLTPCLKHFFKISECLSSCYRNWEWYVSKRHSMSQAKNRKLDSGNDFRTTAFRTLSVLAAPVMYLFYKFHESSKRDPVFVRKPNTEKELEHLNKRIVSRVFIKNETITTFHTPWNHLNSWGPVFVDFHLFVGILFRWCIAFQFQ